MKTSGAVVASALLAVVAVTPVYAQQPGASNDPHHPAPPAGAPATPPPASAEGMKGGGMPMMDMCRQMMGDTMGMPMMDMCRQMMGDTMGMPMMGGAAPADPKERAHMLEMRGEMMKAMGDVMMRHARRMQGTTGK